MALSSNMVTSRTSQIKDGGILSRWRRFTLRVVQLVPMHWKEVIHCPRLLLKPMRTRISRWMEQVPHWLCPPSPYQPSIPLISAQPSIQVLLSMQLHQPLWPLPAIPSMLAYLCSLWPTTPLLNHLTSTLWCPCCQTKWTNLFFSPQQSIHFHSKHIIHCHHTISY